MKLKDYFNQFLEYKRKEGCTDHTLREYKRFLFGALSHCYLHEKEIKDLKFTDVVNVIEAGKQHGEYGSQRAVVVFRQLLKFLEDDGQKLPFNWVKIKVPIVPQKDQDFLTEEEFENFVNKLPLTFYGLRDRAIYEILWATGLRIGELLSLKRESIDWEKKEAKIKTLKTGDEEKVYFSNRSLEWLKKYLDVRSDFHPALFVSYSRYGVKPLTRGQARRNLLNYRRKFGITKKITHHAFRRSFCSLLLEKGATIKEVQYLARHKSERTTLRFYCKIEKAKVKRKYQEIFNNVKYTT